jgi:hypothetical protein
MEENQKIPKGTAVPPTATFTLTPMEFANLQRVKQEYLRLIGTYNLFINVVEHLEQKFLSEGNLVYFYEEDLITENGQTKLREDFFTNSINTNGKESDSKN